MRRPGPARFPRRQSARGCKDAIEANLDICRSPFLAYRRATYRLRAVKLRPKHVGLTEATALSGHRGGERRNAHSGNEIKTRKLPGRTIKTFALTNSSLNSFDVLRSSQSIRDIATVSGDEEG